MPCAGACWNPAEEIAARTAGAFLPRPFANPAGPEIHRTTTAEEIWRDTDGGVDVFIPGVGAGFVPENYDSAVAARTEGILAGASSGANLWTVLEMSRSIEHEGRLIVTVLPDLGERYLSTWLFEE